MADTATAAARRAGRPAGAKAAAAKFIRRHYVGYLFILPFFILFTVFVLVPIIVACVLSFTNYDLIGTPQFVGLINYKHLIFDDDIFLIALKNTLVFACIAGPVGYILSFVAAWAINMLRFKRAFALAFYAPSITSGVAMSVVWLYIFSSDRYGLINNALIQLGMIQDPILWTMDSRYIMTVVLVISIWMSMGTGFLVFLAGLQSINREYYEAADIDGVSTQLQKLWYITLPQMKPQLLFGAINSIVTSFGVFDIAVTVAGMPSPNYAAHTIVAHMYDYAFIRFRMGYASAVAIVLFAMTFILGRLITRWLSTKED